MIEQKIDKYGDCPSCGVSWEGSDVYESLNSLSALKNKSIAEIEAIANNYGWSKETPNKFSKVIVIETEDGKIFYKCPEIRCGHVFDIETGVEYESLNAAKEGLGESIGMVTRILMDREEIIEKFGTDIFEDDIDYSPF